MVIALATMRFMIGTSLCELHPMDEKSSITSVRNNEVDFRKNIGGLFFASLISCMHGYGIASKFNWCIKGSPRPICVNTTGTSPICYY